METICFFTEVSTLPEEEVQQMSKRVEDIQPMQPQWLYIPESTWKLHKSLCSFIHTWKLHAATAAIQCNMIATS